MAFYGLILLAILPWVDGAWASACIFLGGSCLVVWLKSGIDQLGVNQKEIWLRINR